jgi:HSP20 family protein
VRRDIVRDLELLMGDLSRRAADHLHPADNAFLPSVDVYETARSVMVVVEIAGVDPQSLQVTLEEDIITIGGDRLERCEEPKLRLFHMEIPYGRFERRVMLPPGLGPEGARAVYEAGFLYIALPKDRQGPPAGRIPIT